MDGRRLKAEEGKKAGRGREVGRAVGNRVSCLFRSLPFPNHRSRSHNIHEFEGYNSEYSSDLITDVDDAPEQNLSFDLSQNYPNPFNPVTTIRYSIAEGGFVSLKVYDLLGREVSTLVNEYSAEFDVGDLSSGVYLYKLRFGNNVLSRKMMVVK